jgi:hypothetical protein
MLLVKMLDVQTVGIGDRVDHIWYPSYKKDKETGRITAERAQALIQNIWIKLSELTDFNPPLMASGAHTTPRYITIGGQDRLGRDATNELTYIIMDSVRSLKLVEPMISVRLHRNTPDSLDLGAQLLASLFPGFLERYASRLGPDNVRITERLLSGLVPWMRDREPPFVVQHGDYRLDNMLFRTADASDPLAVVDWQTVVWGPPLADASYFLGAGLVPEDRRQHERALLRLYYDALRARGVEGLSWERCWSDYRRYAFSGFLMAVAASMLVVQTERGDEMFLTMARRHGTQILDLEAEEFLPR